MSFLLKGIVIVYCDTEKMQPNRIPDKKQAHPLVANISVMSDAVKRLSEKFTSI
jgi:hypothetical protein